MCVSDFEEEARKVLSKAVYDYYRSGADEQNTLADNVAAFDRYKTRTHIEKLCWTPYGGMKPKFF